MCYYHVSFTKEDKLNLDQNSCLSPNGKESPSHQPDPEPEPLQQERASLLFALLSASPLLCLILSLL